MPLDLQSLSPRAREEYIRAGRHYSSRDTLAQSRFTLLGVAQHGAKLVERGFGEPDAGLLRDAEQFLVEAGVDRAEARTETKVTSAEYVEALREGKKLRTKAQSVLVTTLERLTEQPGADAEQGARQIGTVLGQVSRVGADAEALATQLELLAGVLQQPTIMAVAAGRGGEALPAQLTAQVEALRSAARERSVRRGTPEQTETLDLVDGIIIRLVRQARRAARIAAVELGEPSLATAFELKYLDGR